MSEYKNVVVIGASVAGHNAVNELVSKLPTTHRIILIERNEYAFYPIPVVRAAVVPGWESKLVTPLSQDAIFPANSIHKFVHNTVVELKADSVVLEQPFEGSVELPFDKCLITTGASQPSPMRPAVGATQSEYVSTIKSLQTGIKSATKVLVVGGGAVGVEVTGEIRTAYPETAITIVHSDAGLLHPTADPTPKSASYYSSPPTAPKLSAALAKQLKDRNVDVILSDKVVFPTSAVGADEWDGSSGSLGGVKKVTLQSGKTVEADFVFVSIGNKPNSQLVEKVDAGAVTSNKYIVVDENLKVVGGSATSPFKDNYFAAGDVASAPFWKTGVEAEAEGKHVANNIVAAVKGKGLKKFGGVSVVPMIITLGPEKGAGAGTLTVPIFGTITAPSMIFGMKNADFFAGRTFFGRFQGAKKVVEATA